MPQESACYAVCGFSRLWIRIANNNERFLTERFANVAWYLAQSKCYQIEDYLHSI